MQRNHSYSLQRVNPNIPKYPSMEFRAISRISMPRDRLNFPTDKDSGLYSCVGRKHYENSTHDMHKILFKYMDSKPVPRAMRMPGPNEVP